MNPTLEKFLYLAEEQYLQADQIADYRTYLASLAKKVEVYELMRQNEVEIFKILASDLQEKYPDERSSILCEALSQWSLVLKYCCMAMILDNPDYLSTRVENWLRELIQLRSIPQMDDMLYATLIEILPEFLIDAQIDLLKPFLEQVKDSVLSHAETAQLLESR